MNDLISWVMVRAIDKFGGRQERMFNGACFSAAWKEITGLQNGLDGRAVSAMLHGRPDVKELSGGSHYQLVSHSEAAQNEVRAKCPRLSEMTAADMTIITER